MEVNNNQKYRSMINDVFSKENNQLCITDIKCSNLYRYKIG